MDKRVFSRLKESGIKVDLALPVWIFDVENLVIKNQRYLKIWLFNRYFDSKTINKIAVEYEGKEYALSSFSIASTYENANIVGSILKIDIEHTSKDVKIIREILAGEVYEASNELISFDYQYDNDVDFDYQKDKMNLPKNAVYPFVNKDYYVCCCGRINNAGVTCSCGRTAEKNNEIINFDYEESKALEYVSDGVKYNPQISFEDNINNFCDEFQACTGYDKEDVRRRLILEDERENYNKAVEKYNEDQADKLAKKKKKQKRIKTIIIVAAILIIIGVCVKIFAGDYITYYGCKMEDDPYERMNCYDQVKDIKDAATLESEAFKEYVNNLLTEGKYQEVLDAFANEDEKIDAYKGTVNSGRFEDKELQSIYSEALFMKAQNLKKDINGLKSIRNQLSNLISDHVNEVDEMIYQEYKKIIHDGDVGTVQYFYNRFNTVNKTGAGRVEFQIALENYVIKTCKKDNCLAQDWMVTGYGYDSAKELYEDLVAGGYDNSVLNDQCWDEIKLVGYWKNDDGYYFKMEEDGHIWYNIPHSSFGDYYSLENHTFTLHSETSSRTEKLFSISWDSQKCVKIKSYEDYNTYWLWKQ